MDYKLTPLEALERLTKIHNHEDFTKCYEIIETALKEYEEIKNADNTSMTPTEQFVNRFLKGLNIYQLIFLMKMSLNKKDTIPLAIINEIEIRINKGLI